MWIFSPDNEAQPRYGELIQFYVAVNVYSPGRCVYTSCTNSDETRAVELRLYDCPIASHFFIRFF